MRFTDAKGRKIVSTGSAETVGHVDEPLLDPKTHSLFAVTVKKAKDGDTLPWSSLTAFGDDAVTVPGVESIVAAEGLAAELAAKHMSVLGKRVLTSGGDELGSVEDLDIDPGNGVLVALVLDKGEVAGDRLMGIGTYAVVVRAESAAV